MKALELVLPPAALAISVGMLPPETWGGCSATFVGGSLSLAQRDFRIYDNFLDPEANDNTTPHSQFPGYTGAEMAIWKACVEWGSTLHGDGTGDPTQPGDLGSGGANFDPSFQGNATSIGTTNSNVFASLVGCSGGVIAFTEMPIGDGWRIFFCEEVTWDDDPVGPVAGVDIQAVATHMYGHALGLGHTNAAGATMSPTVSGNGVSARSLSPADICGVQAIYGTAAPTKPVITSVSYVSGTLTITGTNFSPAGNEVWFTARCPGGTGNPVKLTGVPSNGTTIVVTPPGEAGSGDVLVKNTDVGHASLSNAFPLDLLNPSIVRYCSPGAPNETGMPAGLGVSGTSSFAANNLAFSVTPVGSAGNGLVAYSPDQASTPLGNGTLCLGTTTLGFVVRLPAHVALPVGGSFGWTHSLDVLSPPMPLGQISPGSTWSFQGWYRDFTPGGAGFNFTDAVRITFCP